MNQGSPPCLYIPEAEKQARCIDARLRLTVTAMSMASRILQALLIKFLATRWTQHTQVNHLKFIKRGDSETEI
jgi:hypothetical protein